MEGIIALVLTILIFGFLVFVHEAGHFIAAKLNGVFVEEFAFGFGPKLISRKWRGTEYKINLLPLGGYVKMFGDTDPSSFNQDKKLAQDPRSYLSKEIWRKMIIILGGVFVNFVVAILIFQYVLSSQSYKPEPIAKIVNYNFVGSTQKFGLFYNFVDPLSAAGESKVPEFGFILSANGKEVNNITELEKIGPDYDLEISNVKGEVVNYKFTTTDERRLGIFLLDNKNLAELGQDSGLFYSGLIDEGAAISAEDFPQIVYILSINNEVVDSADSLATVLGKYENSSVDVRVLNLYGEINNFNLTLSSKAEDGKVKLGVFPSELQEQNFKGAYFVDYSNAKFFAGFSHSINITVYQILGIAQLISDALQGNASMLLNSVGSPIQIGRVVYSEVQAQAGTSSTIFTKEFNERMLNLTGLLSATLAFMNMLPIPLVDGGQFYLLILEKLRGRPLSEKKQELIGKIGFIFLIGLSAVILLKDIWQVLLSQIFNK